MPVTARGAGNVQKAEKKSTQRSSEVGDFANGAIFWQMFPISGGGRDVGGRGLHPGLEAAGEM